MAVESQFDVGIVGGGPVGLYLAWRLALGGQQVAVFERRLEPREQSRALGIHRPSMLSMPESAREALQAAGVVIGHGQIWLDGRAIAQVDFRQAGDAYPYVLSVPQPTTEQILATTAERAGARVIRGWQAVHLDLAARPRLTLQDPDGQTHEITTRWLIGCDGKHSWLRGELGIPYTGGVYPDHYWMGDFPTPPETLADGTLAAQIYVGTLGLVESLPMPGGQQRWVLRRPGHPMVRPCADTFRAEIEARTGRRLPEPIGDLSDFRAEYLAAHVFRSGRCILVGDAAHVISPIGGQGMNLGWANAAALAEALLQAGDADAESPTVSRLLERWETDARARLHSCRRRSEFNMCIGEAGWQAPWLARGLALALRTPLHRLMARRFSMSDLGAGALAVDDPGMA